MAQALFADISHYQSRVIGAAYWAWTKRLAAKASEGTGFKDGNFESYWSQAQAASCEMFAAYHFCRPDLNAGAAGAANEARWFAQVVGTRLRANDRLMIDFEQHEDRNWCRVFAQALNAALPRPIKPVLYDSASHFLQFFAGDLTLAAELDCALAAWHAVSQGPPTDPAGWKMIWWQVTDNTAPNPIVPVPGLAGRVDVNEWLLATPTLPLPPPTLPDVARAQADLDAIEKTLNDALAALKG